MFPALDEGPTRRGRILAQSGSERRMRRKTIDGLSRPEIDEGGKKSNQFFGPTVRIYGVK